jgi:hypothetical protein
MSTIPPVTKAAISQQYGMLQATAAHFLSDKTLSAPVVLALAAALATEVNSVGSLSGPEKKKLVCDIVESAVETALKASKIGLGSPPVSDEEEKALVYVVKNAVPASLDLIVAAAHGKFDLKRVASSYWMSCTSSVPVVMNRARGPAWNIVEKFVASGGKIVDLSGVAVVKDIVVSVVAEAAVPAVSAKAVDLSGAVAPVSTPSQTPS